MTTLIAENQETAQATAPAEKLQAAKKANARAQKPHVAPSKRRSGKRSSSPKQGAKSAKGRKPPKTETGARQGSKTEKILELLKRAGGATLKEIMKATDWQPHSVRGFLSGTVGKKMGLAVTSTKGEDGERSYSVKG